jgi:hypothetical protein
VPAICIWAQVPHYLGTMGYPAASAALLDGLRSITGLEIDATALRSESVLQRDRIDQLIVANPEHQGMVNQLEAIYDADVQSLTLPSGSFSTDDLPSGDELAAELEQYLRDQDE